MEQVNGCYYVRSFREFLFCGPFMKLQGTGRWTGVCYEKSVDSDDSRDLHKGFESDLAGKSEEL